MPANIFGNRGVFYREPAWHQEGEVILNMLTPLEALPRIEYDVVRAPLYAHMGEGFDFDLRIPERDAIIRLPTKDDNQYRVFGQAGHKWLLITPRVAAEAMEKYFLLPDGKPVPVETMGALGYGEDFFVTAQLPTSSIKGDEVNNYIFTAVPMGGDTRMGIYETPTRVVCWNTYNCGKYTATESHVLDHTADIHHQMRVIYTGLYERKLKAIEKRDEALNFLAGRGFTPEHRQVLLDKLYPLPILDESIFEAEELEKLYNLRKRFAEDRRDAFDALYGGEARGSEHLSFKGTMYGAFNSIVELEDYVKGVNLQRIITNHRKNDAFNLLMGLAVGV